MTLRWRLAAVFALSVAVLLGVGGTVLLRQLDQGLDAALDVSLAARADALAQQVAPDGSVSDFQDGTGSGSVLSPADTLAQVLSSTGLVLESSEGAGARSLLGAGQVRDAGSGPVAFTTTLTRAGPAEGAEVRLLAMPAGEYVPPTAMSGAAGGPGARGPAVVVVVGTSRTVGAAAVDSVRRALLLVGPVVVALAGWGAALLTGAALRPVERMRAQAAAISVADGAARLAVPSGRDEIARLATTLNAMLARLQLALARQRQFVADASHELHTPLTMLRAELELAARPGRDRHALLAAVRAAHDDTERLVRLADGLLQLARSDETGPGSGAAAVSVPALEPVLLDQVAASSAQAAAALAQPRGIELRCDLSPVRVRGDRDRLRQVMDNLLENAVRHSPDAGVIHLCVRHRGSGTVEILVRDDGDGFPPEFLPHAFERFSRADTARQESARDLDGGTGLGLAIVAAVAAELGGSVAAANTITGGAVITVTLPASPN